MMANRERERERAVRLVVRQTREEREKSEEKTYLHIIVQQADGGVPEDGARVRREVVLALRVECVSPQSPLMSIDLLKVVSFNEEGHHTDDLDLVVRLREVLEEEAQ